MSILGPPTDATLADPAASIAYWVHVEAAARTGDLSIATATVLLYQAVQRVGQGHPHTVFTTAGAEPQAHKDVWDLPHPAPLSTVRALLAAGADPSGLRCPSHDGPLVTIVRGTYGATAASLCRAFISAGADVWLRLGREASLLAWAETVEVVEALLAEGVDATTVSYSERSILFCPAALVFPEACRALVAAGANPHLTTWGGLPPAARSQVPGGVGGAGRRWRRCPGRG
jgi:hypothetical protein